MKKITLFFTFCVLMLTSAFAQNLRIFYGNERMLDTIYVNCSPAKLIDGEGVKVYLYFENTATETKSVTVTRKTELKVGGNNQWCGNWSTASCWEDDLTTSSFALAPNTGKDTNIYSQYFPSKETDSAYFWYFLRNANNAAEVDSVLVIFSPNVETTPLLGIMNPVTAKTEASISAYPNPARTNVNFVYAFPQSQANAKILVRDMVGKTIKEISLKGEKDKATISTDDLANGIYFYTLLLNEIPTVTKKLVVKH